MDERVHGSASLSNSSAWAIEVALIAHPRDRVLRSSRWGNHEAAGVHRYRRGAGSGMAARVIRSAGSLFTSGWNPRQWTAAWILGRAFHSFSSGPRQDRCELSPLPRQDSDAVIERLVTTHHCEFVAMGAYGRSRITKFILGGATRHVDPTCRRTLLLFLTNRT